GVYGVMASVVSQQTREIGVRVALGATRERIIAWVLRAASRYVVVGLAIGLLAAAASSRIFAGVLFGVRPLEPVVYLIVALVLTAVGLIAAVLPARRAARVDPVVVLREG